MNYTTTGFIPLAGGWYNYFKSNETGKYFRTACPGMFEHTYEDGSKDYYFAAGGWAGPEAVHNTPNYEFTDHGDQWLTELEMEE